MLRTRERSRTSNTPGLSRRPLPLGYPGMSNVDRRGVEPRASGLQSETVHQHPAQRANGRARTDYLALTRGAHVLTCSAGIASRWRGSNPLFRAYKARAGPDLLHRHRYPRPDSNRHCTAPQTVASCHWATRAHLAGSRPCPVRRARVHPPPTRLRALPVAPSPGLEPSLRRSERRVLPTRRRGKGPAGDVPAGRVSAGRGRPTSERAG